GGVSSGDIPGSWPRPPQGSLESRLRTDSDPCRFVRAVRTPRAPVRAEGRSVTTHAPLLRVDGLAKAFGALRATDDLSMDVIDGEIHALIGPNGAGKTTLVNQLSGELTPDRGRILFEG